VIRLNQEELMMTDATSHETCELSWDEIDQVNGGSPKVIVIAAGITFLVAAAIDYAVDGELLK